MEAFVVMEDKLGKTPVLANFNSKAVLVIQTDTSLKGLRAVLQREGRPVILVL